jgi:hypothetical protein
MCHLIEHLNEVPILLLSKSITHLMKPVTPRKRLLEEREKSFELIQSNGNFSMRFSGI